MPVLSATLSLKKHCGKVTKYERSRNTSCGGSKSARHRAQKPLLVNCLSYSVADQISKSGQRHGSSRPCKIDQRLVKPQSAKNTPATT